MLSADLASLRFLARALAAPAGLILWAWLVGTAVLGEARFRCRSERLFVAVTVGTGIVGTALFLFGVFGLFTQWTFGVAFALTVVVRFLMARRRPRTAPAEPTPYLPGERLVWALVAGFFLAEVGLALLPPTGFDATMYHFTAAKRYLEQGSVTYLPNVRLNWLPQLNEVLFGALFAWGDDVGAQVLQLLALSAGGLGVFCVAARLGGGLAATASTALYLATPVGTWCAVNAYVEPLAAAFVVAGVLLLLAWHQDGAPSTACLAGLSAGFAAATKPTVLPVVACLGALAFASARRQGARRALLPMALLFGLAAGPWYLRTWWLTGDPLYPMISVAVGRVQGPLSESQARGIVVGLRDAYGTGHRLGDFLALPFSMTEKPERFHELGASLSGALPGIALVAVLLAPLGPAASIAVTAVALVESAAWFSSFQQSRFLLPAFALLCSVAGPALAATRVPRRWRLIGAAGLLFLVGQGAWHHGRWLAARLRAGGPVPVDAASRGDYLRSRLRGYRLVEEVDRQPGERRVVYFIGHENLAYFVDGQTVGDWFGPGSYAELAAAFRTGTPIRESLARLGATHAIVDPARLSALGLELPETGAGCMPSIRSEAYGSRLLSVTGECVAAK